MARRAASLGLWLAVSVLPAQNLPQILNVASSVDATPQPYALYLPKSFDPQRQYPLVVSLHSEESNHRLNLAQVLGQVGPGFIVVCPLARGTMGYQGIPEQDIYDVLADVERRYPVDQDRVYLTGISMGGGGALWLAETRPDLWAGVAALCADPMPGSDDLAGNLLNVPVRLYHGETDTVVPVALSRNWQRRLLDLGVPAGYIEYPTVRHNVWDLAYAHGGATEWFDGLHRDRSPERVRFVTRSYQYSAAYWVRIDSLTPGLLTSIDARRAANGDVNVTTANVGGFTILGKPARVNIDGMAIRLKPGSTLSFSKTPSGWRQELASQMAKRADAEGPIVRAVSSRHIYVYGTQGVSTEEEIENRRKQAETAAAWSTSRMRLLLTFAVKADREVTAGDIDNCDLVLFGNAGSNSLIARFGPRLRLELRPDAADYGLLFIASTGRHYLLVNSGLPWWTGLDESSLGGYRWAPLQYRELSELGDYLLFRGSVAQVVAQGRFDANWQLPADAAIRTAATGIVKIR